MNFILIVNHFMCLFTRAYWNPIFDLNIKNKQSPRVQNVLRCWGQHVLCWHMLLSFFKHWYEPWEYALCLKLFLFRCSHELNFEIFYMSIFFLLAEKLWITKTVKKKSKKINFRHLKYKKKNHIKSVETWPHHHTLQHSMADIIVHSLLSNTSCY